MRPKKRYFLLPHLVIFFIWLIYLTYAEVKENTIHDFNRQQLTLDRGCNAFIQKPFGIEVLSAKIREVLE